MDREDIIRMATEATRRDDWWDDDQALERFAALVAAAEREACAELVLRGTDEPVQTKTLEILRKERERISAAIRARGNT